MKGFALACLILALFFAGCGPPDEDDAADDDDAGDDDAGDDDAGDDDASDRLTVRDGDLYLHGARWLLKAVDTTYGWPEDLEARRRMLANIADLGANTIRYGFYISHENIELAAEAGLYVLLMPLNLWALHLTEEEMRDFVREHRRHENVIAWDIGNELYRADFTVPVDLLEDYVRAVREEDDAGRLTFYGNHMLLNAPDTGRIPFLGERGFRPIDVTDVIGWNPYPFFLAASLDEMIGLFWYEIKPYFDERFPALSALIDWIFITYSEWADDLPQWMLDSPFGMRYLLSSYADDANLRDWDPVEQRYRPMPWVLTEWGFTSSPDGIRNVCAIIVEFVEHESLDGFDFHSYPFLDEDLDGVIDHPEAYQALRECFALARMPAD